MWKTLWLNPHMLLTCIYGYLETHNEWNWLALKWHSWPSKDYFNLLIFDYHEWSYWSINCSYYHEWILVIAMTLLRAPQVAKMKTKRCVIFFVHSCLKALAWCWKNGMDKKEEVAGNVHFLWEIIFLMTSQSFH